MEGRRACTHSSPGSFGFLGRHFAAALEDRGYEVARCDPRHDELPDQSDCLTVFDSVWGLDPPDPTWGTKGGPIRFDLVVHCAGLIDGRETIEHKAALIGAYNLQLDSALFEWALRAKPGRIVYLSSSAAYPVSLQNADRLLKLAEPDAWAERDPDETYGWVKLTGERIAHEVSKAGVPVTIVRPFSGYGEDQDDCYPFPAMIARAARHDDPFVVWGDGTQTRDFIHVDDIIEATLKLVDAGVSGPVNLGTSRGVSMDRLAEMCMSAAGYTAPIEHLTSKPQGVRHRVANTELMRSYYRPRVTLERGIERALASTLQPA